MSEHITDEQCQNNGSGAARFCYSCRNVIYVGSRLAEDGYYIDSRGYYQHYCCPQLEEFKQQVTEYAVCYFCGEAASCSGYAVINGNSILLCDNQWCHNQEEELREG